jgi:hypothetical protein
VLTATCDGYRSKLVTATRNGEPFGKVSGLPASMVRSANTSSWFTFACAYVDMKWVESSPGQRKTIADTLTPITVSLLSTNRGRPTEKSPRRALRVAFNTKQRDNTHPADVSQALRWLERNTRPVSDVPDPQILRRLLSDIEIKLDGTRAAYNTIRLRRTTLSSALDFAADERKLLDVNPLREVRTMKRKTVVHEVDRRSVANPIQARTLLNAVGEIQRSGPSLVAFFGLMYFAALRPEEAANLRRHNLTLPATGWGEMHLEKAAPEIGGSGRQRCCERGTRVEAPCGEPRPHGAVFAAVGSNAASPPGHVRYGQRRVVVPRRTRRGGESAARSTAACGQRPKRPFSRLRWPPLRSLSDRTT